MTINKDNLLESILESIGRIQSIDVEDIPNIDLYMDQVTTFMETKLRQTTRHPGEDKILTKTMINNYAKNNLLPSPDKKKYSREHMLVLIFIYYCKSMLSINDIQALLNPITEKCFQSDDGFDMSAIYKEVFKDEENRKEELKADVKTKFTLAEEVFKDAPKEDRDMLQLFAFIFSLGYDVYVKKLLLEKLIDTYSEFNEGGSKK